MSSHAVKRSFMSLGSIWQLIKVLRIFRAVRSWAPCDCPAVTSSSVPPALHLSSRLLTCSLCLFVFPCRIVANSSELSQVTKSLSHCPVQSWSRLDRFYRSGPYFPFPTFSFIPVSSRPYPHVPFLPVFIP